MSYRIFPCYLFDLIFYHSLLLVSATLTYLLSKHKPAPAKTLVLNLHCFKCSSFLTTTWLPPSPSRAFLKYHQYFRTFLITPSKRAYPSFYLLFPCYAFFFMMLITISITMILMIFYIFICLFLHPNPPLLPTHSRM